MIVCANLNATAQKVLNVLYMLTVLSQILSMMIKNKIVGVDVYTIYLLVELAKPWSRHKTRASTELNATFPPAYSNSLQPWLIYSFHLFK